MRPHEVGEIMNTLRMADTLDGKIAKVLGSGGWRLMPKASKRASSRGPPMANESTGIVDVTSSYSAVESIDRLEALARARGLLVFARIDFSADAARTGLALRPTLTLLFGNPRGGTPLLAAEPRVGLNLPLRAVAWEGEDGVVRLSYDAPEWIAARHGLPAALAGNLAAIRALVEEATTGGSVAEPPSAD